MDLDALKRRAQQSTDRRASEASRHAEELTGQQEAAQDRLDYLQYQDAVAGQVVQWLEWAGIDPSKTTAEKNTRFAQQNRATYGAAGRAPESGSRINRHQVEEITGFITRRSRVVHVGNGIFGDATDGKTECYVEFFETEGMTQESPFTYTDGPQVTPRPDTGVIKNVGIRIFAGPTPDAILVTPEEPTGRFKRFRRSQPPHLDERGLREVETLTAELLTPLQRSQILAPQHAETQADAEKATKFAGRVRIPEGEPQGIQGIETFINEVLAAEGARRAEEIAGHA